MSELLLLLDLDEDDDSTASTVTPGSECSEVCDGGKTDEAHTRLEVGIAVVTTPVCTQVQRSRAVPDLLPPSSWYDVVT